MPRLITIITKPVCILAISLPLALIAEFVALEGTLGISLPLNHGSAVSSYEIRETGMETHFITRNSRFTIVDLWSKHGTARQALVLRESFRRDIGRMESKAIARP